MTTPLLFSNSQAFRAWLEEHTASASSLAVGDRKVATSVPSISWSESVDEAPCFGWIDGCRKCIDEHSYMIRFTPRKADSIWRVLNIAKMNALRAHGRMTTACEHAFAIRMETKSGICAYEQARIPALSDAALSTFHDKSAAWAWFDAASPGYRKQMLHWLRNAKRIATRSARQARLIDASAGAQRVE